MPTDWGKLLELVPLLTMGRLGSPQSVGYMGGIASGEEARRKQQIEQQALDRQARLDTQQAEAQQATIENIRADNARAEREEALRRLMASRGENQDVLSALQKAPEELLPPGTDPLQAQNALVTEQFKAQQAYGVPSGTPQGPLPNMTALVNQGKRRRAKALYDEAVKLVGGDEAEVDSITMQSPEFGSVKPSALRAIFTTPAVNAEGQPALPRGKTTAEGTPTTERLSLRAYAKELGKSPETLSSQELLTFNKRFKQSDDRPQTGATVVIQTVDAQGNPVTRIVPKLAGAEFARPATGAQRQQMAENEAVMSGLARIRELAPTASDLAKWVGPVQGRLNSARIVTPGIDVDPKMAEFFSEVAAIKNRMIRAITGAQMSEPEAARIMAQLPDIQNKPSVFLARMAATERNLKMLNQIIAGQSGIAPQSNRPGQGQPDGQYIYVPGKGLIPRGSR